MWNTQDSESLKSCVWPVLSLPKNRWFAINVLKYQPVDSCYSLLHLISGKIFSRKYNDRAAWGNGHSGLQFHKNGTSIMPYNTIIPV